MELVRLRQVAAMGVVTLAAGCTGVETLHQTFTDTKQSLMHHAGVHHPPAEVTQVIGTWSRKLSGLPDPLNDGRVSPGLTGQLFALSASGAATEVNGRVTFAVYDETPRPSGVPERTPEVFDFDPATMRRLRTRDERFGACYVVFLPWPKDWGTEVSAIRISTRYMPDGGAFALTAPEVHVAMDYKGEGLTLVTPGSAEATHPAAARDFDTRGVPDPARLQAEVDSGFARPAATAPPRPVLHTPGFDAPAVRMPDTPRMQPLVPAPPPPVLDPGPPVGQFAPGGGMVVPPVNTVHSPHQTEGAWAGPPPTTPPKGPVLPVPGAPPAIVIPSSGL